MSHAIAPHEQQIAPEVDYPRPERLISGNPRRSTWNHYRNSSGEVFAGVWSAEVGSWRIEMGPSEDEFFFVTAGRCRLVADDGHAVSVAAGQSLVIPAGFSGRFEVLEPMQKHYMIVERRQPST
jgi:uncharacterized protein